VFEAVVNAVHKAAPGANIAFYDPRSRCAAARGRPEQVTRRVANYSAIWRLTVPVVRKVMQHNFRNLRRRYAAMPARERYQDSVTPDMIHIQS
jgi:hypothetical protein